MKQYLDLLRTILDEGVDKEDRTGVGTRSIFGYQMRFDLSKGFPLLTTKRVFTNGIVHELLWFLRGDTNIRYLQDNGVRIWDEWADANGDLGPVYGKQWRSWQSWRPFPVDNPKFTHDAEPYTIDQIAKVIQTIRTNPDSRRLIVSAWNPADVDEMALPPCHCLFQFNTRPMTQMERSGCLSPKILPPSPLATVEWYEACDDKRHAMLDAAGVPRRWLDCQLYQRSADAFLGVPFNIASYALLTHMVARVTGTMPGRFMHTFGDLHIYRNHREQVDLQLSREPGKLPTLWLDPDVREIDDFTPDCISIYGYEPQAAIAGQVAV